MITIISGTNRLNSNTFKTATYYKKKLTESGLQTALFSLTDLPEKLIVSDLYGKRSEEFMPIQELISATEKFIFVIPEYNGSFPGILKLFVDACNFPESFSGKKAALVGISSGKYGNIRGVEHFTGICHYINMSVLPMRIHIPAIHKELDEDGNFYKEDTLKFVNEQLDRIITF